MKAAARRAGICGLIVALGAAVPAGGDGLSGSGSWTAPWVSETVLSPDERRQFEDRREALETRAGALAARVGSCGDLRSRVREELTGVQHVHAVEVGLVLLTSDPPRMPVTFAVALDTGRVVWDRLTVTVPVRPRLVLLGGLSASDAAPLCAPGGR
jgi:hypothetical protein